MMPPPKQSRPRGRRRARPRDLPSSAAHGVPRVYEHAVKVVTTHSTKGVSIILSGWSLTWRSEWYNESGYQSHRGRSSFPPLAESIVCSGRIASRSEFDTGGHVYLATVVGYLVAEVLEMTRNAALAARKLASSNFINNWLFAMTRNSINFSQA
uniref:Histone H2A n=1 Tax=Timema tahoe TaxID=61484 RepID=A0A7R9NXM7_9NEOP|nr:unnamed protein product [Timema tahoe]